MFEGKRQEPEGLAAPDRHPHVGDFRPQRGLGHGRTFGAVHRHFVAGRNQAPDQVTQGGLGPAQRRHPLSYERDLHMDI